MDVITLLEKTANPNNKSCVTGKHNHLYVLPIIVIVLLMKLVMGQSGLILSDLLRLVRMGAVGPKRRSNVDY